MRLLPRLALVLLALALASSLPACRRARAHWGLRAPSADPRVVRGRAAYVRYCALCHGDRAQGYAADHANALRNPRFLAVASDDFLRGAITDGRPGTPMSPWSQRHGGPLDDRQIGDIVRYLRSLARGRPAVIPARAPGSAAGGRSTWLERCQSCHGSRGEGTAQATSVSHPNFLRAASDGYIRYTLEHGRPGTLMQSFAPLGPQALDDLVAFIRTLEFNPSPPPPPVYEPPPSLDHLVMNPTGSSPTFHLREGRYVPAAEVARAMAEHRRMVILDTRATSDWSANHMTGAMPYPFYDIEQMATRLPRDGTWILAYCACPHAASGHVVDELRRRRFPRTAVIDEGITFWTTHGYPTARAAIVRP